MTEEFSYFEEAKFVTNSNCRKVVLESTDIHSTELEQLHLRHIYHVVFKVFILSSISSLEIEDVGNLTGLPKHIFIHVQHLHNTDCYRSADKFLVRPGRKQATATEDFEFHISYL